MKLSEVIHWVYYVTKPFTCLSEFTCEALHEPIETVTISTGGINLTPLGIFRLESAVDLKFEPAMAVDEKKGFAKFQVCNCSSSYFMDKNAKMEKIKFSNNATN